MNNKSVTCDDCEKTFQTSACIYSSDASLRSLGKVFCPFCLSNVSKEIERTSSSTTSSSASTSSSVAAVLGQLPLQQMLEAAGDVSMLETITEQHMGSIEQLLEQFNNSNTSNSSPSPELISKLKRIPQSSSIFSHLGDISANVTITISGIPGSIIGVPANFGIPFPTTSPSDDGDQDATSSTTSSSSGEGKGVLSAPFVLADPLDCSTDLRNEKGSIENKILIVERGKVSFARKGIVAQNAGAIAVIVIQTEPVFPYKMNDAVGIESKELRIPMAIISKEAGSRLKAFALDSKERTKELPIMKIVAQDVKQMMCSICQDTLIQPEGNLIVMPTPCCHVFHEDCLLQWFSTKKNTCPMCRYELVDSKSMTKKSQASVSSILNGQGSSAASVSASSSAVPGALIDDPSAQDDESEKILMKARELSLHNMDAARELYEKVLDSFPLAGKIWVEYAQAEMTNGNYEKVKAILLKTLPTCYSYDLWLFYLQFIKKTKLNDNFDPSATDTRAREEVIAAYKSALDNVGFVPQSLAMWKDWISLVGGMNPGSDFSVIMNQNVVRDVYMYVLRLPLDGIEQLFNDYQNFEKMASATGTFEVPPEVKKAYDNAVQIQKERAAQSRGIVCDSSILPKIPSKSVQSTIASEMELLNKWRMWIAYETRNPEQVAQTELKKRVRYVYHQALTQLRFYPEIWYDFAMFEKSTGDENASENILKSGISAMPDSSVLNLALAEYYENARKYDEARNIYEILITEFPSPVVFISYQRFSRRAYGIEEARLVFKKLRLHIKMLLLNSSTAINPKAIMNEIKQYASAYISFAQLEFLSNGNAMIARNIYELAMKTFPQDASVVLEYVKFLQYTIREKDGIIREIFERAIASIPTKSALSVWVAYRDFELNFASNETNTYNLAQQIQQRIAEAYPDHPQFRGLAGASLKYQYGSTRPDQSLFDSAFYKRNFPSSSSSSSSSSAFVEGQLGEVSNERSSSRSRSRGRSMSNVNPNPSADGEDDLDPVPQFLEELVALLPKRTNVAAQDPQFVMNNLKRARLPPRPIPSEGGRAGKRSKTGKL